MEKREAFSLAKKLKGLREGLHLTQKDVASKAGITESAYRAYELGDRNPKLEVVNKIAKALGVSPEYLSAPTFRNRQEFAYALLENEDVFGYTVCDIDGVAAITASCGQANNFFSDFIHEWGEMRKKFDDSEITQEEYEEWKRRWDDGSWIKG